MSNTYQKSSESKDQNIPFEKLVEENSISNKETSARTNGMDLIKKKQFTERMETDESLASLNSSEKINCFNTQKILVNSSYSSELEKLNDENKRVYVSKQEQKTLLKSIECTTGHILFESILLIPCSMILKFCMAENNEGFPVACILLSISSFLLNIFLMVAVKFGFSNDPNGMKFFRVSIITVFLVLFVNFGFQVFGNVNDYLNSENYSSMRVFSYSLLGFSVLFFIPTFIKGLKLSLDSLLILVNCKKEYNNLFDEKQRYVAYGKYCQNQCNDFRGRGNVIENFIRYMPGTETISEKISPKYNRFHNSISSDRDDDKYYRKLE